MCVIQSSTNMLLCWFNRNVIPCDCVLICWAADAGVKGASRRTSIVSRVLILWPHPKASFTLAVSEEAFSGEETGQEVSCGQRATCSWMELWSQSYCRDFSLTAQQLGLSHEVMWILWEQAGNHAANYSYISLQRKSRRSCELWAWGHLTPESEANASFYWGRKYESCKGNNPGIKQRKH